MLPGLLVLPILSIYEDAALNRIRVTGGPRPGIIRPKFKSVWTVASGRTAVTGLLGWLVVAMAGFTARGDGFDRLEGPDLGAALNDPAARKVQTATLAELDQLPRALPDLRSTVLLVQTDQGAISRLVISSARRRKPGGDQKPLTVAMVERFATFDSTARAARRTAAGSNLPLFDGFHLDLDGGYVVPADQGGDLLYDAKENRLHAGPGCWLVLLDQPPAAWTISSSDPDAARKPTPGRKVVPQDFAGRFRYFGDGGFAGVLTLTVDDRGELGGSFRSDANGATYPLVNGRLGDSAPNHITFTLELPRARLEHDAHLWTDGKAVLAGTARLQDRPSGFYALREE